MKKTKKWLHKAKVYKTRAVLLAEVAFNNRLAAMNHCIVMRSNSVNFLTLYSIIFFDVFFIKALFCRRHGIIAFIVESGDY